MYFWSHLKNITMKIKTTILALALIVTASKKTIAVDDTLTVKLKLKSTSNVLTFNQPHVNPEELEYLWEIKIDSDNNQLTGDSLGFDVGLSMSNTKFGTSLSYTGTIISGSQQNTVIYTGSSATYGNELFVMFNDTDTSLMIKGLREWPELAGINAGDRMVARSYFNGKNQKEYDYTSTAVIPGKINDLVNDVNSDFIDIISVQVEDIALGVSQIIMSESKVEIFPNPSEGRINITEDNLPIQVKNITIINSLGKEVKSGNEHEIDLSHLQPGVYFVKIKSEPLTHRIIINR